MTELLLKRFTDPNAQPVKKRQQVGTLSSIVGIIVNVLLAASKIVFGLLSGAISLLGDGINNFFDALSAIIALISFRIAAKPADEEHPFGHARFEYIASSIVALSILYVGIQVGIESIQKIIQGEELQLTLISFIVLVMSLVVKLWLYFFYQKLGNLVNSELILANAADSMSDILGTSAILIALLASHFLGWKLDGPMGIVVAFLILSNGYEILRNTYDHLMGKQPSSEEIERIREHVLSYPGIHGVHDILVHEYGPGVRYVTLHVEVDANENVVDSHDLVDKIEKDLEQESGVKVTIHIDPLQV